MDELVTQNSSILLYALVGFFAQMIDGCLGMAYGVAPTRFFLPGVPPSWPAPASMPEGGYHRRLGLSHSRVGSVDRELALGLIVPGVVVVFWGLPADPSGR